MMNPFETVPARSHPGPESRDSNGMTALMRAVDSGQVEIVKRLLRAGADLNATDKWGQTALMLAAGRNDVLCTKLLIQENADLNIRARNGLTALGYAADNNQRDTALLLKRAGAR